MPLTPRQEEVLRDLAAAREAAPQSGDLSIATADQPIVQSIFEAADVDEPTKRALSHILRQPMPGAQPAQQLGVTMPATEPAPPLAPGEESALLKGALHGGLVVGEAAAGIALPELVGVGAGAALLPRMGRALARALLAGVPGVGVEAGRRALQGTEPMSSSQLTTKWLAGFGPELVFSLARIPTSVLTPAEEALINAKMAESAARAGVGARAGARGPLGISEAATTARLGEATGAVRGVPSGFGPEAAAGLAAPEGRLALGRDLQMAAARAEGRVEKLKGAKYATVERLVSASGARSVRGPELLDEAVASRNALAEASAQSPTNPYAGVVAKLDAFIKKIQPPDEPSALLTPSGRPAPALHAAPQPPTTYAELDDIRETLQPYLRAFSDRSRLRAHEDSVLGKFYNHVEDLQADLRRGVPGADAAYRDAVDYYVNDVLPLRGAGGAVRGEVQPSKIASARVLLAPGNEDHLVTILKEVPLETANRLRAFGFSDGLERAVRPDGSFDPDKALKWWRELGPRRQAALSGAGRETTAALFDGLKAAAAGQRATATAAKVADKDLALAIGQLDRAEAKVMQGAERLAHETARFEKRSTALWAAAGTGLGLGIYKLTQGDILGATYVFGGTFIGRQALSLIFANPRAAKLYRKAMANSGGRRAAKFGTQAVLQIGADLFNDQALGGPAASIEGLPEPGGFIEFGKEPALR